ncbi:MAG TPA: ammonium transporter [Polyangiaceae bacterium]|nr:ammonium transporter [Polyangiaceae bacterium]
MKRLLFFLIASLLASVVLAVPERVARADEPVAAVPAAAAPAAATSDVEKRLADLEAYVNNGARVDDKSSKILSPGPGHNGFMMICAALVLFMTLPGLALFYGGLVRQKNVLSVMAQCMGIAALVTLLWWAFGYSLTFSPGTPLLGGMANAMLRGVGAEPNTAYAGWVSQSTFSMYQLMFAIITPALIIGSIAERVKFSALMVFVTCWMILIYFPLAHMVWGADGMMNGVFNKDAAIKAVDFAGGTVVHMSSGWSALVLALIVGHRVGFGKEEFVPHSLVLTMVGTGMLWVGWYGFNAGSAVAADGIASQAFMTTTLAAAIAGGAWAGVEWLTRGKPTVLGFCSGIVGGLVVITPAAGFVTANGAMLIGILAGVVPFFACTKLKHALGYDDALDTFGVHAIGGTLGAFVTGLLATPEANPNLLLNLKDIVGKTLWLEQLKAMGLTLALSIIGTAILGYGLKFTLGLRPTAEEEESGLDLSGHGEKGYDVS